MVDVLLWSMLEMWSLYIFWVNITVIKYQAFMHLNQTIYQQNKIDNMITNRFKSLCFENTLSKIPFYTYEYSNTLLLRTTLLNSLDFCENIVSTKYVHAVSYFPT